MTKKAVVTAAALVAILVVLALSTGVAFAATRTITGEVISAELSAKTLMIKAQGQEMSFSVADRAATAMADLKPGDQVTVNYTEAEGKRIAQSITKG
ncbi:MAG TPA: hypothetical protein VN444_01010 [Verrucomicrobiae bacterium]|nr:hypothetical protein [Verrucomicrobiae bacterium]